MLRHQTLMSYPELNAVRSHGENATCTRPRYKAQFSSTASTPGGLRTWSWLWRSAIPAGPFMIPLIWLLFCFLTTDRHEPLEHIPLLREMYKSPKRMLQFLLALISPLPFPHLLTSKIIPPTNLQDVYRPSLSPSPLHHLRLYIRSQRHTPRVHLGLYQLPRNL